MIVYKDLTTIEHLPGTYVALGYFDGIHAGHQALIERCVWDARANGALSCVFTFSNSPKMALKKRDGETAVQIPQALMTWEEKVHSLEALGVDLLVAPAFDETIRPMSPETFVRELLIGTCNMTAAYCGFNYSFGHKAAGKAEDLLRMGEEGVSVPGGGCEADPEEREPSRRHFRTYIQPPYTVDGRIVSSTLVRESVSAGEMETANRLLGHTFSLEGETVPGRRIGSAIGFPTANFIPDPMLLLPPDGVYATLAEMEGTLYPGVTNIGRNPTVSGADENGTVRGVPVERRVETHLFDPPHSPDGTLYGRHIRVFFYRFLRGEVKFRDETELRDQIARDKATARMFWTDRCDRENRTGTGSKKRASREEKQVQDV